MDKIFYHDIGDYLSREEKLNILKGTGTFQLGETDNGDRLFSKLFKQNLEQVEKQRNTPSTVIMGNPRIFY
jgi:predicted helicase